MSDVKVWTIATGKVRLTNKHSRDAAKYIAEQDGFVDVHIIPDGRMLWLFDSENHAKVARNNAEAKGIVCGKNIGEVYVDEKYLKEGGEE